MFLKSFPMPGLFALAVMSLTVIPGWADQHIPSQANDEDLMELSLEDLLDIKVTSVSKKAQSLSEAAAAVFVISQDDIRRSGVTTIPEALRMVPGVQVARIDANKWAISARGFNGRFANKLLVLIDGRSVYTPFFSGVFWDVQDTVLEDIDRIEVIRGPGATLWGANAVNGVINIITKAAANTQGGLVSAGFGTEERGFGTVRYGSKLGDNAHYRVYAKYFDRDGGVALDSGDGTADDWHATRAGFRLDWAGTDRDAVTVQGDIYDGDSGETIRILSLQPPFSSIREADQGVSGGNILMRWERTFSELSDLTLQFYYDRTDRDAELLDLTRDTFDIDFQHRFPLMERHDLIWGLGYRYTEDDAPDTFFVSMDPDNRDYRLFSGFVQDDITLVSERLKLILGSKFEHNDYTGFEVQPNARLLWTPDQRHSLWASVARAVRTPSRGEYNARVAGNIVPPGHPLNPAPVPAVTRIVGNDNLDAEELIAYELGYRIQASERLRLDIAAFYNDYDKLIGGNLGAPVCEPSGAPVESSPLCVLFADNILIPIPLDNNLQGKTYGLDLTANWRTTDWWNLQAAYSYLKIDLKTDQLGEFFEKQSPNHQISLRSSMDLPHDVELDLWLRYTDNVTTLDRFETLDINSYVAFDARLAWRPHKDLELSIVGQNLLDDRHPEFTSELGDIPPTEVERSGYLQLRWTF